MNTRPFPQPSTASNAAPLRVLGAEAVLQALTPQRCLEALEDAYAALHAAPDGLSGVLAFAAGAGKIHIKAGLAPRRRDMFAAKINANFPNNPRAAGLPTVQGIVALVSAEDGRPLAILHSGALTALRTAAASALAAKHGAKPGSRRLCVIGAGAQAAHHIDALALLFPLEDIVLFDIDAARATALARRTAPRVRAGVTIAPSVEAAARGCDICVTATTATAPVLFAGMAPEGAFVAAIGADSPGKQELDPSLFRTARIIVDDATQCAASGELAHALAAGVVGPQAELATLAELAAGVKTARRAEAETVIFDSTGSGVQDVAAAAAAFLAARRQGLGVEIGLD